MNPISERVRIVIVAAGAAAAAAILGLTLAPVKDQATARVVVTPFQATDPAVAGLPLLLSAGDPTPALITAQGLVGAAPVAQLTAERMGPGWSEARVVHQVEVTLESGSQLIDITANAAKPSVATRLANVYAAAALQVRGNQVQPAIQAALARADAELGAAGGATTDTSTATVARASALRGLVGHGDPSFQLAQPAYLARRPGFAHSVLIVLLALASGAVLGYLAWWLAARLGRRGVADEHEILKLTGLPILGRLPEEIRGEWTGLASAGVRNALTRLELQEELPPTLALVSPEPGDGKTSAAVALALHITERGSSVAVLDLDWRRQDALRRLRGRARVLSPRLGSDPTPGAEGLTSASTPQMLFVSRVEGPQSLPEIEERIADAQASAEVVILDTPPISVSPEALVAAASVQSVLIVVQLGQTPARALVEALARLARAGVRPAGALVFHPRGLARYRPPELDQIRPRRSALYRRTRARSA